MQRFFTTSTKTLNIMRFLSNTGNITSMLLRKCVISGNKAFFYLASLFFVITLQAIAQKQNKHFLGKPIIQNFSPHTDYHADPQNFDITQDQRGYIYVANSEMVLEYNGISWRKIYLKNKAYASSLLATDDGRVYVGGVNEAGYLEPDEKGQMQYHSLLDKIHPDSLKGKVFDFWYIEKYQDNIYFRDAYASMMATKEGKVKLMGEAFPHGAHQSLAIFANDSITIHCPLDTSLQIPHPFSDFFDLPHKIVESGEDSVLLMGGQYISKSSWPLKQGFLQSARHIWSASNNGIQDAMDLGNGLIALATAVKGVIIIDEWGKEVRRIDKASGLKSNCIWRLLKDRQDLLWIVTDNGISRTAAFPNLEYWDSSRGMESGVVDIVKHEGRLYMATRTDGIFSLNEQTGIVESVGRLGELYRMKSITNNKHQDALLITTDDGLYEVKNHQVRKVGVDILDLRSDISQSKADPSIIYLLSDRQLISLQHHNGQWRLKSKLPKLQLSHALHIEEHTDGTLWIDADIDGMYLCITPSAPGILDNAKVEEFAYPLHKPISLPDGNLWVGLDTGMAYFPSSRIEGQKPQRITDLGERYGDSSFFGVNGIISNQQKGFWIWASHHNGEDSWIEYVKKTPNGYQTDSASFVGLPTISQIYKEANGDIWMGGLERLFRYRMPKQPAAHPSPKAIINKITIKGDSILTYSDGMMQKATLPYECNSLGFSYFLPSFIDEKSNLFQYRLVGYEDHWSDWASATQKEYTNLYEGDYVFEVRGKDVSGIAGEITPYAFTISPPWYRTWEAIAGYILAGIAIVWLNVKIYTRRLKKEKALLEEKISKRTQEIQQKNVELYQQKEEILAQTENLKEANERVLLKNFEVEERNAEILAQKNQLEEAYEHVEALSGIGKTITAHLDIGKALAAIYGGINQMMSAHILGLGIYNKQRECLDFPSNIVNGEIKPAHQFPISEISNSLAVWCYLHQSELIINDFEQEATKLMGLPLHKIQQYYLDEPFRSLMYMPLYDSQKQVIGVITIQSHQTNAYEPHDANAFRGIANYMSIALENAKAHNVIAKKSHDITNSINYAYNIQQAMLPRTSVIERALPNSFILFMPRDVVSGDFYWIGEQDGKTIVAAVDCTGHGVPGAFMSLVGNGFLSQIIHTKGITSPKQILTELHKSIYNYFHQSEGRNKDGMDIALCTIDYQAQSLVFAGAKSPLVYITPDGELHAIKGSRMPIGGHTMMEDKGLEYEEHTLPLQGQTQYFIHSDGYQDQFGGDMDTKLNRKNFRFLLKACHEQMPQVQQHYLEEFIGNWMGNLPQLDDILVMGFKA